MTALDISTLMQPISMNKLRLTIYSSGSWAH